VTSVEIAVTSAKVSVAMRKIARTRTSLIAPAASTMAELLIVKERQNAILLRSAGAVAKMESCLLDVRVPAA